MAELIQKEGNKVSFKFVVPANEVNRAYDKVWSNLAHEIRVPGFRPGKAPRSVLEKRVGADYVQQQVFENLLSQHLDKAASDLDLALVDFQVQLSDLHSGKDCEITIHGEVYPEIKLGNWKDSQLEVETVEITDEILERTLQDIQERNAVFESVDRAIEANDQVTILEEGDEGGSYPIYLDVAPENIRNAFLGKHKGDTVEVNTDENGAVRAEVLEVKSKKLPELNDEFAATLNLGSMERLRTELRNNLVQRASQETMNNRRESLVNKLMEDMEVEIPRAMIERRGQTMLSDIQNDLKRQGVLWSEYESFMKEQDRFSQFMENLIQNAEKRVRRDLALDQLARDLKVEVSNMELNQLIVNLANSNNIAPQEFVNRIGQDGINNYYFALLRERALEQAVSQMFPSENKEASQPEAPKADESKSEAESPEADSSEDKSQKTDS